MRTLTTLILTSIALIPGVALGADDPIGEAAARLKALAAETAAAPVPFEEFQVAGDKAVIFSGCDGVGGISYDDGDFTYGIRPSATGMVNVVTKFNLPQGTHRLKNVCMCWIKGDDSDGTAAFYTRIWSADGPDGSPGTLLGESQVTQVSDIPGTGRYYTTDLSHLNLQREAAIYIGARWSPGVSDVYLCADDSETTPARANYAGIESPGNTVPNSPLPEEVRALGVRATFEPVNVGPGDCTANSTTLCLNGNRFQVNVEWEDPQGQTGTGKAVAMPAYDDSGLFYFFSQNNLELLIKVLDGCSINDRYWVFFAATTNVEFTVTVTDTVSGATKTYNNLQGQDADAVTDTGAFDTCN